MSMKMTNLRIWPHLPGAIVVIHVALALPVEVASQYPWEYVVCCATVGLLQGEGVSLQILTPQLVREK